MTRFANERIRAGLPMPGIFEIRQQVPIALAIAELLIIDGASDAAEWENQVTYIPLR